MNRGISTVSQAHCSGNNASVVAILSAAKESRVPQLEILRFRLRMTDREALPRLFANMAHALSQHGVHMVVGKRVNDAFPIALEFHQARLLQDA